MPHQLRYACARVVTGCQGLTFADKSVLLLQASHECFTRRRLYVAASRVTDPTKFAVATPTQEQNLLKDANAFWQTVYEQRQRDKTL